MGYISSMDQSIKKKVTRRLNIVQGQVKGLLQLVDEEKYCIDIITQSSAIKEALTAIEHLILQNHLSTHVIHQIKSGKETKAVEEILKVYKLSQKIK